MSFHARELLFQFLKFENMILLMNLLNQHFTFEVARERTIIDLLAAKRALQEGKFSTQTYLVSADKKTTKQERQDIETGRLHVFTRDIKRVDLAQETKKSRKM